VLPRHRHAQAFAAVILAGRYVEAGDSGLHRVDAGHVLLHAPHEWHLDRVGCTGAEVLVLPLPEAWTGASHARVEDPGALARLAESDMPEAAAQLLAQLQPMAEDDSPDWPEQLASALLADPSLSIAEWAHHHQLHPGSVSRGFRQVFEISPKAFRLHARTHLAMRLRREGARTASAIAHESGFADQAHLCRSIATVTAYSPKTRAPRTR
jgi:AraC-like DNA-binding protein